MDMLAIPHRTSTVVISSSCFPLRALLLLQISAADAPAAMIIQSAQTKVQFFRYEAAAAPAAGVLDVDGIRTWVGGFFAGSLTPSRTERLEPYF